MTNRVVILGGAGFIGSALGQRLTAEGVATVCVDRLRPPESADFIESLVADCRNPSETAKLLQPGDVLVHLIHSSIPTDSMADPDAEQRQNIEPYARILDAAAEAGVSLVVYGSSGGQVYGNVDELPIPESAPLSPLSNYGKAKAAMEKLTRDLTARHGIPHLILRPGNPYGPGQERTNRHGAVPALIRAALTGQTFTAFGVGETVRDYIYIHDAAALIGRLIKSGAKNQTVNIGTGLGASLTTLIGLIEKTTGRKITVNPEPLRSSDVRENILDVSLLHQLIGPFELMTLPEGLHRTHAVYLLDHAKDHGDVS